VVLRWRRTFEDGRASQKGALRAAAWTGIARLQLLWLQNVRFRG
jgi:hypothetical protein